ncbi:unnamed protein product [Rotaria sp. Silwood2]|nr:unnamed protein product [Rotaria sp. Silwood2]
MKYLIPEDITVLFFSTEEQLWYWLNIYSSVRVASLVIQTNINIENIVRRSSAYAYIRSILIRCPTNELITLKQVSRSYVKIDGIFADDTRLLIKLVVDLALLFEEIGDRQREDENNELAAQRNYDRAANLCHLIDVIYDGVNELKRIRRRFQSKCKKVEFYTIYDLLRHFEKAELDKTLVSSNSIDLSTIDAILSIIQHRLHLKKLGMFNHLSSFLKQCTPTPLYGLPAKNIKDFAPCFICPSCKLIYEQLYRLECEHQQCKVCVNIQENCARCFKMISRDKVSLVQDSQMKIQDLSIGCSSCEWTGSLEDYHVHFKQKHDQLITCAIFNQDVNISYQQDLTGMNQEILLHNHSPLDSNVSMTSLNGTCIWGISDISDMKNNSASDEQKSIYSSSFYIFPNGYKICLRLFLNGDAKARGTHMSLYFVLMRGNYDYILHWPFQFKIIFTLLNHLSSNNNHTNFLWPDTKSNSFQCPRSDMNIAYGISKFFPLDLFKQNESHYVKNNKMFIKIEVDFVAERPILPLITDAGELLNEEELVDTTYDNLGQLLCLSDAL